MSQFTDLEELVCDADNTADLLYSLIENRFSVGHKDNIVVTRDEASRIYFAACLLMNATSKVREGYYAAWDTCAPSAPKQEAIVGSPFDPSRLNMGGLFALHDALRTLFDVLSGLLCQPRFLTKGNVLSPAGEMLDGLGNLIAGALSAIHNEACARPATSPSDAKQKFFFLANRYVNGLTEPAYAMEEITKSVASLGEVRS